MQVCIPSRGRMGWLRMKLHQKLSNNWVMDTRKCAVVLHAELTTTEWRPRQQKSSTAMLQYSLHRHKKNRWIQQETQRCWQHALSAGTVLIYNTIHRETNPENYCVSCWNNFIFATHKPVVLKGTEHARYYAAILRYLTHSEERRREWTFCHA